MPTVAQALQMGWRHHHADRQRSIPLVAFALAAVPGVRLISLPKGDGSEQIRQLWPAFEIADFSAELDHEHGPFMDTAAIAANLDLVVLSAHQDRRRTDGIEHAVHSCGIC
jgi:hypothetical protein